MIANFCLLALFMFLLAAGIMRQPNYIATTSNIFPSLIYPANYQNLAGMQFRMKEGKDELKPETTSMQNMLDGEELIDQVTEAMPPEYGDKDIKPRERR